MCLNFSMEDIQQNKDLFFANETKLLQDMYITRLVSPHQAERRRVVEKKKQRNLSLNYHLCLERKAVCICQKIFASVLGVSKFRVLNLCEKYIMKGKSLKEKRGGDRKKLRYGSKRKSVQKFIEGLEACESHHGREKPKRIYLASTLSIAKLWKIYNANKNENLQVKYRFFMTYLPPNITLDFHH